MPVEPDEVVVLFPSPAAPAAGWILAIPGDPFLREAMNFLEHACCPGSTVPGTSRVGFAFLPGEGSRP